MNEEEIFHEALAHNDPKERAAYLDQACAADPVLRASVEALLRANVGATGFLDHPPAGLASDVTQGEAGGYDPAREDLGFLTPCDKVNVLGRLGHYEVLEIIGKGGMGIVLRAFDQKLHRIVAIKVLAPALAANGTARKRFIREAQAAAAVKNDYIVAIYNVEDEHQPPYLVMELIDGYTLQAQLDRQGPLELREILRIGMQTAAGLAAAHKQGLVHRDIKPANILLENGVQRVKITDFGLAKIADDASVTQTGVIAGTPMYMSPEQAEGQPLDHRSDLFSLGSVLYLMAAGRPSFRGASTVAVMKRVCEDTPRPLREINPEMPEWLGEFISRLHAKKPEDRIQTSREVEEILGAKLAELQARGRIQEPPPVESQKGAQEISPLTLHGSPRRRGALLAALIFLMMGAGLALFFLPRGDAEKHDPLAGGAKPAKDPGPALAEADKDGWVQLFNGVDLAGWKTHRFQDGDWRVEKGILVGRASKEKPISHLFTERGDFTDFHLRVEAMVTDEAENKATDGGMFVRCEFGLGFQDNFPLGYETQMSPNPSTGNFMSRHMNVLPNKGKIRPGHWNLVEVIARANHFTVKVNDETTVNVVDDHAARFQRGHIAFQFMNAGTIIRVKKVEIKHLPATSESDLAKIEEESRRGTMHHPFVILASGKRVETHTATLADAVKTALSGDTIEIRGDGPFVSPSIDIREHALTIRAGKGYRPVIRGLAEGLDENHALFKVSAALVLEGLDLQVVGRKAHSAIIATRTDAPLFVANCRLLGDHFATCIWAGGWPTPLPGTVQIRNSELYTTMRAGGVVAVVSGGDGARRLLLDNCVQAGSHALTIAIYEPETKEVSIHLTRNTFVATKFPLNLWNMRSADSYATLSAPLVTLNAAANILDGQKGLFAFEQHHEAVKEGKQLPLREAKKLLQQLLVCREHQNVLGDNDSLLEWLVWAPEDPVHLGKLTTSAEWDSFWTLKETRTIVGRPQFQGDDIRAKPLDQISPEDFRLRADSAGYKAGKDGKNLGADVDLVGPGQAYERWKKTPEYQQWLKDAVHATLADAKPKEPAFRPLFLGTNLDDWEGDKAIWKLQDGQLVGTPPPGGVLDNTFLLSKKRYKDFELKFQVRLKDGAGNSGVQIRSETIPGEPPFRMRGPQADIGDVYWGTLWGEQFPEPKGEVLRQGPSELLKKVLKPNDFNDYYVKCVGKRVTIQVNGLTTVDEEFAHIPQDGLLGWQMHFGDQAPREVVFRDVQIRLLADKDLTAKPVLRMHFDKDDFYQKDGKTYVRDHSGEGNDGLCEQVQFTPEGMTGGGLANEGKGFLRLPTSLVANRSHFTVAAWVKRANLANSWAVYTCMAKDYPASISPCFNFFCTSQLYVGAWNRTTDWLHASALDAKMTPGEWVFVAVTLEDGAPGKGRLQLMLNDRIAQRLLQQAGDVPLGGIQDLAAFKLEGAFDELTVWQRALTEQELREVFALGHPRPKE